MYLKNSKIIVIKIGSSLLIDENKKIRKKWLSEFSKDIKDLLNQNKRIIIVSSGAIAMGCKKLNLSKRTVETHITSMLAKLEIKNRVQLTRLAMDSESI